LNAASTLLIAVGALAVLVYTRSSRIGTPYPFLPVSAALLAMFLLFTKVHSPQHTLWILPFFVLLNVRLRWWLVYALVDLAVYVSVYRWNATIDAAVLVRAALLAALVVIFLRSTAVVPLARRRAARCATTTAV
jgi:hypothetical protein